MSKKHTFDDGVTVELDDDIEQSPEEIARYEAEDVGCDYESFEPVDEDAEEGDDE